MGRVGGRVGARGRVKGEWGGEQSKMTRGWIEVATNEWCLGEQSFATHFDVIHSGCFRVVFGLAKLMALFMINRNNTKTISFHNTKLLMCSNKVT